MSASKHNQFATKPADQKAGDTFTLRAPTGLKGRAVRASRARGMKLSRWLVEAIGEKCDREEVISTSNVVSEIQACVARMKAKGVEANRIQIADQLLTPETLPTVLQRCADLGLVVDFHPRAKAPV